jgi:hypothetical protein
MNRVFDYPLLVFALSLLALWLSAQFGAYLRRRRGKPDEGEEQDLGTILAATLTLLALIIGFTFSMANNRYDRRKDYEATEANAIGTEYVRSELLPPAAAAKVKGLLKSYLNQRVLFYTTRNESRLQQINATTVQLQTDLWSAVRPPSIEQGTPTVALAVAGMNDVLNSQAYTLAAWWNRIPVAAWNLMEVIAICANVLFGYTARRPKGRLQLMFILPLIVSIAFFLIADIDSPRGGLIRLHPQNLESLVPSMSAQ